MCGIVGIFAKVEDCERSLGAGVASMLAEMAGRGPDSAGVAIYRNPVADGHCRLSLLAGAGEAEVEPAVAAIEESLGATASRTIGRNAVLELPVEPAAAAEWVAANLPATIVSSVGRSIETYKDAVSPAEFVERFGIASLAGTHALGHTRMATESMVTPEGSHPFSAGVDLCLVHNGSLSNHNRLRAELEREGARFRTRNDSEVAAAYLASRLAAGASLDRALAGCLEDLDGFYTFAVATADGFAVLRDPIACKPAVMAETDEWVAMASEYRALATLPGAADAEVWEPEPGVVYDWGRAGASL